MPQGYAGRQWCSASARRIPQSYAGWQREGVAEPSGLCGVAAGGCSRCLRVTRGGSRRARRMKGGTDAARAHRVAVGGRSRCLRGIRGSSGRARPRCSRLCRVAVGGRGGCFRDTQGGTDAIRVRVAGQREDAAVACCNPCKALRDPRRALLLPPPSPPAATPHSPEGSTAPFCCHPAYSPDGFAAPSRCISAALHSPEASATPSCCHSWQVCL